MSTRTLCTLQGVKVTQDDSGKVSFTADADIDADGSPHAYHPNNKSGLDDLRNAGYPGNWFGVVTNNGKPDGQPFLQSAQMPAPGFYVSATAYQWPGFSFADPDRYLDSETVPYVVVEGFIRRKSKGVILGCRAKLTNKLNGKTCDAVVGDTGPLYKIGEISIAAAKALGINASPRNGGMNERKLLYELWPDQPAKLDGKTYNLIPAVA